MPPLMNSRLPNDEHDVDVELRYVATLAIVAIALLMRFMPPRFANHPRWLIPAVAVLLALAVLLASRNPSGAEDRRHRVLRVLSLVLIGALSVANAVTGARLVSALVQGEVNDADVLLLAGGAVWITNVIVFALWYWELDRGGPLVRWRKPWREHRPSCDFLFPQMDKDDFADDEWRPEFVDYLYLAFTNATAFSPTDVMPLSRWAKLAMMLQSSLSIVIIVLVVARAVNVLN
jgi:hypothetical protein